MRSGQPTVFITVFSVLWIGFNSHAWSQSETPRPPDQGHLCEGEGFLDVEDPYDPEGDYFVYKAKSYTSTTASDGLPSIVYELILYVKTGHVDLYNGGKYFIEWLTIDSPQIRDSHRLLVSPLFRMGEPLRSLAENRFLMIGWHNVFHTWVRVTDGVELKDDQDSFVVVRDLELNEVARFHCPAWIPKKAQ